MWLAGLDPARHADGQRLEPWLCGSVVNFSDTINRVRENLFA